MVAADLGDWAGGDDEDDGGAGENKHDSLAPTTRENTNYLKQHEARLDAEARALVRPWRTGAVVVVVVVAVVWLRRRIVDARV